VARDASLWGWFKGNETVLQKQIAIDLTPPTLELIADDRYISFGGAGALVYRPRPMPRPAACGSASISFPAFPARSRTSPTTCFVFFAHPYDTPPGTRAVLVSTDKAGNTREMPLAYELKDVKYRKSTIALSDSFLQNTVSALARDPALRQGSAKDLFVAVNKNLRKENEDRIAAVTKKASPSMLWKGAFSQLSNSKVEANFADLRTYVYKGEAIDTAYHVGYDLSVTKRYPVEAANSGSGGPRRGPRHLRQHRDLDHGLGLFTLYSHLSAIDVKVGEPIEPKQILGRTGETGLAGGDHLHYGSTCMAWPCCRWSGGTASGSTTTSRPSSRGRAETRSRPRRRRRNPGAAACASAADRFIRLVPPHTGTAIACGRKAMPSVAPIRERRVGIRVGLQVVHRHQWGKTVVRRVSELLYVSGRPVALIEWINLAVFARRCTPVRWTR
jgi:hypothetical protein